MRQAWQAEREHLRPLPAHRPETCRQVARVADKFGHVKVDARDVLGPDPVRLPAGLGEGLLRRLDDLRWTGGGGEPRAVVQEGALPAGSAARAAAAGEEAPRGGGGDGAAALGAARGCSSDCARSSAQGHAQAGAGVGEGPACWPRTTARRRWRPPWPRRLSAARRGWRRCGRCCARARSARSSAETRPCPRPRPAAQIPIDEPRLSDYDDLGEEKHGEPKIEEPPHPGDGPQDAVPVDGRRRTGSAWPRRRAGDARRTPSTWRT